MTVTQQLEQKINELNTLIKETEVFREVYGYDKRNQGVIEATTLIIKLRKDDRNLLMLAVVELKHLERQLKLHGITDIPKPPPPGDDLHGHGEDCECPNCSLLMM